LIWYEVFFLYTSLFLHRRFIAGSVISYIHDLHKQIATIKYIFDTLILTEIKKWMQLEELIKINIYILIKKSKHNEKSYIFYLSHVVWFKNFSSFALKCVSISSFFFFFITKSKLRIYYLKIVLCKLQLCLTI